MDARAALTAALAADRGLRRRAAAEAFDIPEGLVVRDAALHDVHYLNAVVVTDTAPDEVPGLAERWLAGRGHRHVVFQDGTAGEAAAARLAPAGWERRRTLVMALDPRAWAAGHQTSAAVDWAPAAGQDARARPITEDEMDALQLASLREEIPASADRSGVGGRLAATQAALRRGTDARCFGAGEDGGLHSMCTLFLDPDAGGRRVATVQEVATLSRYRRRGLARAAVSAAITAALAWDAEVVSVAADADDWPQLLYAGLGFVPVGLMISVTRRMTM